MSEVIGLSVHEVVYACAGSIAKTSSGKRQRRLTKKRYLSNTLGRRTPFMKAKLMAQIAYGRAACAINTGLVQSA